MDRGTVGNSLIGIDALLKLLAVEEVAEELLDLGDTGAATNKHNLVDLALLKAGIFQDLFHGLDRAGKGLAVDVLKSGTSYIGIEIFTVVQRVDLNSGLSAVRKGSLCTLACCSQTAESSRIVANILLRFALEFLLEVLEKSSVEVGAT